MIVCTALLQKHFSSGWLKNKYFHLITWRYRGWFLYKPARRKSSNSTEVNGVTLVWNQGQIRIGPLWCADCLVPQRWHLFEQTSMLRSCYNSFSFIIWCALPLLYSQKKVSLGLILCPLKRLPPLLIWENQIQTYLQAQSPWENDA